MKRNIRVTKKKLMKSIRKEKKKVRKIKLAVRSERKNRKRGKWARAGHALGGLWGPGAASIGESAGDLFSKITGMGDYKVSRNTLITDNGPPIFGNSHTRSVRVRHREFLTSVGASQIFTSERYPLNPASAKTFPWLSSIALGFQQYRFDGLVFMYKTTSGAAVSSTNTGLGVVIGATQYNVKAPPFRTRSAMENYEFATSCVPSANMIHPVECAPGKNVLREFFTSTTHDDNSADARFRDLGEFQLAVEGTQGDVGDVGELWVSYDVVFSKPMLAHSSTSWCKYIGTATTSASGLPLGPLDEVVHHSLSTFGLDLNPVEDNYYQIKFESNGVYLVMYEAAGSTMVRYTGASISGKGIQFPNPDIVTGKAIWDNEAITYNAQSEELSVSAVCVFNQDHLFQLPVFTAGTFTTGETSLVVIKVSHDPTYYGNTPPPDSSEVAAVLEDYKKEISKLSAKPDTDDRIRKVIKEMKDYKDYIKTISGQRSISEAKATQRRLNKLFASTSSPSDSSECGDSKQKLKEKLNILDSLPSGKKTKDSKCRRDKPKRFW